MTCASSFMYALTVDVLLASRMARGNDALAQLEEQSQPGDFLRAWKADGQENLLHSRAPRLSRKCLLVPGNGPRRRNHRPGHAARQDGRYNRGSACRQANEQALHLSLHPKRVGDDRLSSLASIVLLD